MKALTFGLLLISLISLGCNKENPIQPEVFSVNIDSPLKNASVHDSVSINISASGINEVGRVELYIDNQLANYFTKPPFLYIWCTSLYSEGSQHVLLAKAYDTEGNIATSKAVLVYVYRFQPSNLLAFILNDTTAVLTWSDNSSFETGYEIEESINNSEFKLIKTDLANTTTDTLLSKFLYNYTYHFRVRAKTATNYSRYSNIALAQIYLTPPSDLKLYFESDTIAVLTWKDNSYFEDGFYVYNPYSQSYTPIATVDKNVTTARISGQFFINYIYSFTVKAFSNLILSDSSNVASGSPVFGAPSDLTYSQISKTQIQLNWKDNSLFEKGFAIERDDGAGIFSEIKRISVNITAYNDIDIDTTKTYKYRVRAYTDLNYSKYSNTIKISFLPNLVQYKIFDNTNFTKIDPFETIYSINLPGFRTNIHSLSTGSILKSFYFTPDTFSTDNASTALESKVVTISPDWSKITAAGVTIDYFNIESGNKIATWNGAEGWSNIFFEPNRVTASAFISYGTTLITSLNDSTLRYWNLSDQTLIKTISVNYYSDFMVPFENMNKILTSMVSKNFAVINPLDGSVLYELTNSDHSTTLQISKDERFIIGLKANNIFIWNSDNGSIYKTIPFIGRLEFVTISPDNKLIMTSSSYSRIQFWDVNSSMLLNEQILGSTNEYVHDLQISKNGNRVYSNVLNKLVIWDLVYKWTSN